MFGVRYPMTPLLLQLMLNQPISSAMMKRMFGCFGDAAMAGSGEGCSSSIGQVASGRIGKNPEAR